MNKIGNKLILPVTAMFLVPCANVADAATKQKKANVILFLVDDQGWYQSPLRIIDSMENGNSEFIDHMPNFMKLSQEASRFSQAYSSAPVSGPSRACIQSGKTVPKLAFTDVANWERPSDKRPLVVPTPRGFLQENEVTIAELIKQIDSQYATAHFGKWHCDEPLLNKPMPNGYQGYDYHDGEFGNSGPAYFSGDNPKDIFGITNRGLDFISEQVKKDKPFYMQLSHYALHKPSLARPETIAKYENKGLTEEEKLGAAVAEDLDAGFGMILERLKELGIEDNTYIIWTSDNGIPNQSLARRSNYPLRGIKLTLWEGGIRVPLLIKGPGIEKGRVVETPVVGYDLMPTICDMIGGAKKLPDNIDGGSFYEVLKGKSNVVKGRGETMFFHYPHYRGNYQIPSSAAIKGDWKIIKNYETGEYLLFNLRSDILEQHNLAQTNKEKFNELKNELDTYLQTNNAPLPTPNPTYKPLLNNKPNKRS